MTQRGVRLFLGIYFLITFGAVFLRVDYFPLSWVPMYGRREPAGDKTFFIGDLERRKLGFGARRADGEQVFISPKTLNIPSANFRRLYMQRAFNGGPPHHTRERLALMPFNRWWYETLIGPDPLLGANYPAQLLRSINQTLGFGPDDSRRIVWLEAHVKQARFSQADLDIGDLSKPQVRHATVHVSEAETILTVEGSVQRIAGPRINTPPLHVDK
jgi:hypothetical protein